MRSLRLVEICFLIIEIYEYGVVCYYFIETTIYNRYYLCYIIIIFF